MVPNRLLLISKLLLRIREEILLIGPMMFPSLSSKGGSSSLKEILECCILIIRSIMHLFWNIQLRCQNSQKKT